MGVHVRNRLFPALVAAMALGTPASALAEGPLKAEWFFDTNLTQLVRVDSASEIDFKWDDDENPEGVGDTFSARWTGRIVPRYSETYIFPVDRDDGVRLWVDGQLLINDDWSVGHTGSIDSAPIALEAGVPYDLRVEFVDGYGEAEIRLRWESDSQEKETVPASSLIASAPPEEPPAEEPPAEEPPPTLMPPAPVFPAAPAEPEPEAGRSVTAAVERGVVRVRVPGSTRTVKLDDLASLPVGSIIDARRGTARLHAEGERGKDQTVAAWGSVFRLTQSRRGNRLVTMTLRHPKGWCKKPSRRGASISRARPRGLWGKGKGKFRTRGRHGSATVRGTTWHVEDRCDSTITRVRTGLVAVRDFARRRTVLVPAGSRYVARARR